MTEKNKNKTNYIGMTGICTRTRWRWTRVGWWRCTRNLIHEIVFRGRWCQSCCIWKGNRGGCNVKIFAHFCACNSYLSASKIISVTDLILHVYMLPHLSHKEQQIYNNPLKYSILIRSIRNRTVLLMTGNSY